MFDNLTYKQKFLALILVVVMLSFAAYKRSFSVTLDAKKHKQELAERFERMDSETRDAPTLTAEIRQLDGLIGGVGLKPEVVQQGILDFISKYSNVTIKRLDVVHEVEDRSFVIYSNQLTLSGDFNALLHAVYELEKKFKQSNVVNVNFYTTTDHAKKKEKLYAKILFQNYEKIN